MSSALYTGSVVHHRFQPKAHRLRYGVFCLNLDLDELGNLNKSLHLFGHNRFALFSFHDADHGELGKGVSLRAWVDNHVRASGHTTEGLKVEILCYPRILGYVFNPLTVYYCRNAAGELICVLYEVCNTFHERHTYVISCANGNEAVRHSCDKAFYVSPFMPMDCRYHFHITAPQERVAVHITQTDARGKVLYAGFEGARRPLTDAGLLKVLLRYPLMTLKVTLAIHYEAVRLLLKGLRVYRHTPAARRVDSSVITVAGK